MKINFYLRLVLGSSRIERFEKGKGNLKIHNLQVAWSWKWSVKLERTCFVKRTLKSALANACVATFSGRGSLINHARACIGIWKFNDLLAHYCVRLTPLIGRSNIEPVQPRRSQMFWKRLKFRRLNQPGSTRSKGISFNLQTFDHSNCLLRSSTSEQLWSAKFAARNKQRFVELKKARMPFGDDEILFALQFRFGPEHSCLRLENEQNRNELDLIRTLFTIYLKRTIKLIKLIRRSILW